MKKYFYYFSSLIALSVDQPGGGGKVGGFAPSGIPQGGLVGRGPQGTTTGQQILQRSMTIIIVAVIILSLLFLLWGGIQMITSGGDKNKVDAARKKIIYAIVGLLVVFFSFAIILLIGQLFDVNIFGQFVCPPGLPCNE